ncbi:DNA polymerase III subunit gamma and tau [Cellulomonas composti]|uniref:DNA polymerase III subunit gamma and tau n=1 Tax=Cellulomonas composti TaxID=266130 RepID=UPI0011BFAE42|nr:DNA polymerase III subunit gamma and tau [Cellulomonas composti]
MTTALYRRYRPETFAEVIGQDHVTAPLRQALRSGQVNHAYLFSGPRGCGKTTSARILARILNCAQNTEASPSDTPCGVCESCVELARGGPGSLDVVEIDAASHGGVDDARELRERATFAPARDRFKIFILDEAHMVTTQGFNALLKIVEEPPPHIKFVFATTEPDKVIGTIRSRTHHYPFRLVPPDVLLPYLDQLCAAENVPVGGGVLPLVVRAGGGSVRDTLSVLDQLIAGSGEAGIEYAGAAALLGYTQSSLLDDLVDAIAARDGGAAFRVVERVIATGHEPRRFVEDLLERLRDLIVIDAAGEAAGAALRGLPEDQLASMRVQATRLGPAELSRSADLANTALTEMIGATSPRLHLELLMARLLLPAADDSRTGVAARLDRLERGAPAPVAASAPPAPAEPAPTSTPPSPSGGAAAVRAALAARRGDGEPDAPAQGRTVRPAQPRPAAATTVAAPVTPAVAPAAPVVSEDLAPAEASGVVAPASDAAAEPAARTDASPDGTGPDESSPSAAAPAAAAPAPATPAAATPAVATPAPAATGAPASASGETEVLRRRWPEVLDTVRRLRKVTGALVDPSNVQVAELDATTLRLAFSTPELANTFRNGQHADVVARAVHETLGFDVRVEAAGDGASPSPHSGPARGPAPSQRPTAARSGAGPEGRTPSSRPGSAAGRETSRPGEPDDEEGHRRPSTEEPVEPVTAALATSSDEPAEVIAEPAAVIAASEAPSEAAEWEPPEEPEDPWSVPGVVSPAQAAASWGDPPPRPAPGASTPARAAEPGRSGSATPAPARSTPAPARAAATPRSAGSGAAAGSGVGAGSRAAAASAPSATPAGAAAIERARRLAGNASRPSTSTATTAPTSDPYDELSPDDPDVASSGLVGAPLVAQLLGGTVIDEQLDDPTAS